MKKIFFLLIILIGVVPSFKNGRLLIVGINTLKAQDFDPDMEGDLCYVCPSCCEDDGNGGEIDPCEEDPSYCFEFDACITNPNICEEMDVCTEYPDLCSEEPDPDPALDPGQNLTDNDETGTPVGDMDPGDMPVDDVPDSDDPDWADWFYGGGGYSSEPPSYTVYTNLDLNMHANGSEFLMGVSSQQHYFTLSMKNPIYTSANIVWKMNGSVISSGSLACSFYPTSSGTYTFVAYGSGNALITVKALVFGSSIVTFSEKSNFDGSYGFDNVGFNYSNLKPEYISSIILDSKNYNVPWLSLTDGQEASVKVNPIITSSDQSNPSYWVKFVPSDSKIVIKNSSGSDITNTQLNGSTISATKSIKISCTELDATQSNHTKAYINVINNNSTIIGKISVSCQVTRKKKLVIVYVKDSADYPASRDYITNINLKFHNQIFNEFQLQSTSSYPNTIDASYDWANNNSNFSKLNILNEFTNRYYAQHNIDPVAINKKPNGDLRDGDDPDRVYFLFITLVKVPGQGGSAKSTGNLIAYITDNGTESWDFQASSHELGHCINLEHTFEPLKASLTNSFFAFIPKYATLNVMDYNQVEKYYFLYQWTHSY